MIALNFKGAAFFLISVSLLDQSFGHIIGSDLYEKERPEIHYNYNGPMRDLEKMLHIALEKCNRFPSEKEFKEFILNGSHPGIKCTEKIMIHASALPHGPSNNVLSTGRNIPQLVQFLETKPYKVYSDTKKIHVILDLNPSDWKYKTKNPEEVERIISCIMNRGNCLSETLKIRAESCRFRKEDAELYCHLGDNKIIEYDLGFKGWMWKLYRVFL